MTRGGLVYALAQLSERERLLLLLLGVVVVPVAVVFLAVLPMLEARDEARADAREAAALLAWVSDQVRALPAEGAAPGTAFGAEAEPIGISGIEESLVRIDLRPHVSQLANRSAGGVEVALDEAPFDRLGDWLTAMAPVWGYEIASFRIEAASAGLVNATFDLAVPE